MKDNINFKDVRLTIEQPSEKLSELIYDSFGYKGFKTPQKISQNLLEAKEAYELNEYFQYVIYFKNTPIGLLKMELIETKRGKSLNSGLRFNESRVYKMGLFIGD